MLFGGPLFGGGNRCLCIASTTDAGVFAWALAWWPHALVHGLNPFHTQLLYAPQGFNIAHGALIPGAAMILAPVTAIAGPLSAYNLAMLLSPVLAAFFAFLLCRRLTGAFWPSLLGGWLFGFSTYMLGQVTSHLDLTLVFAVPAAAHVVVRALDGDIGRRRFVVLLTLVLALQFSFSVEVFASLAMFGAIALALGYALGDAGARDRLRDLLVPMLIALLATAVIVSPYLYYALKPGGLPVLPWRTDKFSSDLAAFVLPTQITQLGGLRFLGTTNALTSGYVESAAYLGLPLLVMIALAVRAGWRRPGVMVLAATLLVVALFSLGGRLHVGGSSSIPLPWALLHGLPVLGLMLPARFMLYGSLIASVLAAMWLATGRRRAGPWLLALASVVSLLPAVGRDYWHSTPALPRLFTTSAYRHQIGRRDIALVLPVGIDGQSMLWQAEAHLGFTMASGYVVAPEADDPYKHYPIYPTLTYSVVKPGAERAASAFLSSHHVTVAILDAAAAPASPWPAILAQLGWGATTVDGALIMRPEGIVPPPAQPAPPPSAPLASGPPAVQRAARRAAAAYFQAFSDGDAAALCALLTPAQRAAQIQRPGARQADCARALVVVLRHIAAFRAGFLGVRIGPVTVYGDHAYAAIILAPGRIAYLPLRLIGGRWLADGTAR